MNRETTTAKPRGLLITSLIYATGDLLTKGARFVLIPYYIAMFTAAEVGEWGILQAVSLASFHLLGLGMPYATRRFYLEYGINGDGLVSTFWLTRILLGLPLFGLLLWLGYQYQQWSANPIDFSLVALSIGSGFMRGGNNVLESWYNIREEALKYRGYTFCQFLTTTLIIIVLVSGFGWGLYGAILGETISFAVWTLISGVLLLRKSAPIWSGIRWGEIFRYSWPTLPHAFFMWAVLGADRLILQQYVSRSEQGTYEVGYALTGFVTMVVMGLLAAWTPRYFRSAAQPESGREFGRFTTIYLFCILLTTSVAMLLIPELFSLIELLTAKDYSRSIPIFRVVLVGVVGFAAYGAFIQPFLYSRRTLAIATTSGLGCVINLIGNFCLVPYLGIMGAAITTVVTYFAMAIVIFVWINIGSNFLWQTRESLVMVLTATTICLSIFWLPPEPWGWGVIVKAGMIGLFLALLVFKVKARRGTGDRWFRSIHKQEDLTCES